MRLVGAVLLPLCLATACRSADRASSRLPNIVLIVIDTLRADRLGCYGNRRDLTPFLDELAAGSTIFHRAYAQSSWTVPSVASLLSSRFPSQHGAVGWLSPLRQENRSVAEVLHEHGYDTAGWSANTMIDPTRGYARGFDYFKVGEPTKLPGMGDLIFSARAERLNQDAKRWVAARAEQLESPVPTFLYFQYMETHYPYAPSAETLLQVSHGRAVDVGQVNALVGFPKALALRDLEDVYDAEVTSLDTWLRELFANLTRLHFLDHAVVVVTSDHGDEFEDHGGRGHGGTLYDELIRIPLLVQLPGQTRRRDVDELVSLIDVGPTFLDLAGIPPPTSFEGRSFRRALSDRRLWVRVVTALGRALRDRERPAFSELLPKMKTDHPRHDRAVIRGSHKLLVYSDGRRELFDLAADPQEAVPLDGPTPFRRALETTLEDVSQHVRGASPPAPTPAQEIDEKARERLKALGYAG